MRKLKSTPSVEIINIDVNHPGNYRMLLRNLQLTSFTSCYFCLSQCFYFYMFKILQSNLLPANFLIIIKI